MTKEEYQNKLDYLLKKQAYLEKCLARAEEDINSGVTKLIRSGEFRRKDYSRQLKVVKQQLDILYIAEGSENILSVSEEQNG